MGTPPSWMILSMNLEAWSHSPSAISLNNFERGSELIPVAILLKYRYLKAAKVSPARAWLRSSRSVGSFLTDKTGRTIAWCPGVFLALFQQARCCGNHKAGHDGGTG